MVMQHDGTAYQMHQLMRLTDEAVNKHVYMLIKLNDNNILLSTVYTGYNSVNHNNYVIVTFVNFV